MYDDISVKSPYIKLISLILTFIWSFPLIFILYMMSVLNQLYMRFIESYFEGTHFFKHTIKCAIAWYCMIPKSHVIIVSILSWINIFLFTVLLW